MHLKIEHHMASISIERPKQHNALSRRVIDQLDEIIETIKMQREVKVLLIRSNRNFAAGADIREMAPLTPKEAEEFSFSSTYNRLAGLEIPTVAAIEGYALGGGLELALACDLRIAASDARLGFPEITLGIFPGAGGTVRLVKVIGEARAKEMIFFGNQISGQQAADIGLVHAAVPSEKLDETAAAWCECLALRSGEALAAAKASIHGSSYMENEEGAIAKEGALWARLFGGYNQKEGMNAFLEKRIPEFNVEWKGDRNEKCSDYGGMQNSDRNDGRSI